MPRATLVIDPTPSLHLPSNPVERTLPHPRPIDSQGGISPGKELLRHIRAGGYVLSGHARGQAGISSRRVYSRIQQKQGTHRVLLAGAAALSPEFKQLVRASVAEVDWRQIDIYRQLPATARFRQGSAISDAARNVVAYRIRQEHPELTLLEANRMALQRAYTS